MHKRRKAVTIAILAVAVVGAAVSPASARNAGADPSASEDAFVEAAAWQLAADAGIDLPTARERVEWEDLFEQLAADAAETYPETFAGTFIDREGDGKLTILFTSEDSANSWTAQHSQVDSITRTEIADKSLHELTDESTAIRNTLEMAGLPIFLAEISPSENAVRVVLGDASDTGRNRDNSIIDEASRILEVGFPGAILEEKVYKLDPEACSTSYRRCDAPLRGGVEIGDSTPGGAGTCTIGFRVTGDSGAEYVITAGHCFAGMATGTTMYSYTSGGYTHGIGPLYGAPAGTGPPGMDARLVRIQNFDYWGRNYDRIFVEASPSSTHNTTYHIASIGSSLLIPSGASLCKTGASSATTCGKYEGADPNSHYRRAKYASCGGDSGGPVFRVNKGYGLHSRSTGREGEIACEYDTTGYGIYQLLGQAMTALNVHLN